MKAEHHLQDIVMNPPLDQAKNKRIVLFKSLRNSKRRNKGNLRRNLFQT